MVDHPRRCERGEGGKENDYAAQHIGGGLAGRRGKVEHLVIPLTYGDAIRKDHKL